MLIPLSLVIIILIGFGIFQIAARPGHLKTLTEAYQENAPETIEKEKTRVYKDKNAFAKFKIAWGVFIVVGLIFYFLTHQRYSKGLALGILFLAISALIIDTIMQDRSATYYENIAVKE